MAGSTKHGKVRVRSFLSLLFFIVIALLFLLFVFLVLFFVFFEYVIRSDVALCG